MEFGQVVRVSVESVVAIHAALQGDEGHGHAGEGAGDGPPEDGTRRGQGEGCRLRVESCRLQVADGALQGFAIGLVIVDGLGNARLSEDRNIQQPTFNIEHPVADWERGNEYEYEWECE